MAYDSAFSYSGKYVRQLEMRTDLSISWLLGLVAVGIDFHIWQS